MQRLPHTERAHGVPPYKTKKEASRKVLRQLEKWCADAQNFKTPDGNKVQGPLHKAKKRSTGVPAPVGNNKLVVDSQEAAPAMQNGSG